MSGTTQAPPQEEKAAIVGANDTNAAKIKKLFEASEGKISALVPKHLTAERLVKVALAAIFRTPGLMECHPMSLVESFMQASQLGLECGGVLGHAYHFPYKSKQGKVAQFIIGYRGMIELARRTGQVRSMEAVLVREGDEFQHERGLHPILKHVPAPNTKGREIVAAYAIARLVGGETCMEIMWRDEIDGIRARSKAGQSGPWVSDFGEMARKTVIRRLWKYLPTSIEIQLAVNDDREREEGFIEGEIVRALPGETKSAATARAIAQRQAPPEIVVPPASEPASTNSGTDPDGEPAGNLFEQ